MAEGVQEGMLGLGGVEEKTIVPVDPINNLGFIPAKDNQGCTGFYDAGTGSAYIDGILYRLETYTNREGSEIRNAYIISSLSRPSREDLVLEYVEVEYNRYNIIGIRSNAFDGCSIKSVRLGDSIEYIAPGVFANCRALRGAEFGKEITSIPGRCFTGCSNLSEVVFKGDVTEILNGAFSGCGSLRTLTIPDTVICVEESAFCGCDVLDSLTLPSNLTYIPHGFVGDCSSLESVYIKSPFINIDVDAFIGCPRLKDIYCAGQINNINVFTPTDHNNKDESECGIWLKNVKWHYGWKEATSDNPIQT